MPDRACLTGPIFGLKTGIPWAMDAPGAGLGPRGDVLAALARLAGGRRVGGVAHTLLDRLGGACQIDLSRASLDRASVPAKRRAT